MKKIEIGPEIKGLIFDLDGTLVDTMHVHFEAWQDACSGFGFNFTEEILNELAGVPTGKIVEIINSRYGLSLNPDEIEELKESSYLNRISTVKPVEPVMELMKASQGRYAMSIGTGGRKHVAMKTIELSGLDRYISIVVTADDVQRHKPEPDTFLECARLMGLDPGVCLVFEDGDQGLAAADAAGMPSVDIREYI